MALGEPDMPPYINSSARCTIVCAAHFVLLTVITTGCRPAGESIQPPQQTPHSFPEPPPQSAPSTSRAGIQPKFVDVAHQVGIDFTFHNDAVAGRYFLPEVMGGGIAWIDVDGDDWLDLFLANGCTLDPDNRKGAEPTCRLYRNVRGERFQEITIPSGAGITLYGQGCAVGDYDADGFNDLFVSGYDSDILLHNSGDGTFQDVTVKAGVSDPAWSSSSMWVDLDGDRDLDLYVTNYMDVTWEKRKVCMYGGRPGYCSPGTYSAVQDRAYLNLGDGVFRESSNELGLRAENGKGLAVAAVDFDGDLIPEIYVANDMTANFLFSRRASPGGPQRSEVVYRELATEAGCAVSGSGLNEASMGIAIADFDHDGRADIYLTHYYRMKNTLYRNLGGLLFEDASYHSRAAATGLESLGFGTASFDYDRDGDADLMIANGHVLGPEQPPNLMSPQLLRNDGGIFADVSSSSGQYFGELRLGRSVAAADYDNDGDIDFAISHLNSPFVLLKNETSVIDRPFIGLKLTSMSRGSLAGGRVVITVNDRTTTHPLIAGGSYLASADERVLVAWPTNERPQSLEVRWPSGLVDRLKDLGFGQYWRVVEGNPPQAW